MPAVYGLADPHLGRSVGHSMERYGAPWLGHPQTLFAAWDATVPGDATVLVPGDLSVASDSEHVVADYRDLDERSGALKLLSPGNHDRGVWDTQGKAERALAGLPSLVALKGQALRLTAGNDQLPGMVYVALCGALSPGCDHYGEHPDHEKQYARSLPRLQLALDRATALTRPGDRLVLGLHYPPFLAYREPSPASELIESSAVSLCVYGHLHTPGEWERAFQGARGGCTYRLIASDYLHMVPLLLGDLDAKGLQLVSV